MLLFAPRPPSPSQMLKPVILFGRDLGLDSIDWGRLIAGPSSIPRLLNMLVVSTVRLIATPRILPPPPPAKIFLPTPTFPIPPTLTTPILEPTAKIEFYVTVLVYTLSIFVTILAAASLLSAAATLPLPPTVAISSPRQGLNVFKRSRDEGDVKTGLDDTSDIKKDVVGTHAESGAQGNQSNCNNMTSRIDTGAMCLHMAISTLILYPSNWNFIYRYSFSSADPLLVNIVKGFVFRITTLHLTRLLRRSSTCPRRPPSFIKDNIKAFLIFVSTMLFHFLAAAFIRIVHLLLTIACFSWTFVRHRYATRAGGAKVPTQCNGLAPGQPAPGSPHGCLEQDEGRVNSQPEGNDSHVELSNVKKSGSAIRTSWVEIILGSYEPSILRPQDLVLTKHIGIGGFGRVYQVKDNASGAMLAMKRVSKKMLGEEGQFLILDEIRALRLMDANSSFPSLIGSFMDERDYILIMVTSLLSTASENATHPYFRLITLVATCGITSKHVAGILLTSEQSSTEQN
jgi:hypothetical protein